MENLDLPSWKRRTPRLVFEDHQYLESLSDISTFLKESGTALTDQLCVDLLNLFSANALKHNRHYLNECVRNRERLGADVHILKSKLLFGDPGDLVRLASFRQTYCEQLKAQKIGLEVIHEQLRQSSGKVGWSVNNYSCGAFCNTYRYLYHTRAGEKENLPDIWYRTSRCGDPTYVSKLVIYGALALGLLRRNVTAFRRGLVLNEGQENETSFLDSVLCWSLGKNNHIAYVCGLDSNCVFNIVQQVFFKNQVYCRTTSGYDAFVHLYTPRRLLMNVGLSDYITLGGLYECDGQGNTELVHENWELPIGAICRTKLRTRPANWPDGP